MISKGNLMYNIRWKLETLTSFVKKENKLGMTNINHDAEEFYAGLLSIVLNRDYPGISLHNLNALKMNFPAIDLADLDCKVCIQVTSTEGRTKIQKTLDKFFAHGLDTEYGFKKLIVLVIGEKPAYKDAFSFERTLDFNPETDVWDTEHLIAQIDAQELDVVRKVDAYLREHLEIMDNWPFRLNLPLPMTMEEDRFIGREEELAEIRAKLEQSSVVYLTGLGGMGKTELAIKFGREYRDGEVYFVRFQESFERTVSMNVAQGIEGLLEQGPEVAYAEAMKRLGKCGKQDILIIDNADAASGNFADLKDNTWTALRQLPMKLLITTRCEVAGAVKVGAMEPQLLRQLFANQELELTTQQMDDLIDAVKGHTMMVDMMAKTLRRNRRLTAEHLLQTIEEGTLPAERLRAIAIEKNGNTEQEQIYVHLKNLFSMAELSDEDKAMLTYLVLLPDGGLDMEVLEGVLTEEGLDELDNLLDSGWLNYEPKTKRVSMHPVVRLVCREELKPDDEDCSDFLRAVRGQYDEKEYNANRFRQYAELFTQAVELLPDREGDWAAWGGYLWHEVGQLGQALDLNLRAVKKQEEQGENGDKEELATCFNNLGTVYDDLGNHQMALEYKLKAMEIWKGVLSKDHLHLAAAYNNIGMSYGYLGKHEKALEYKLKAMEIQEKKIDMDHPLMAGCYNNVGLTYGELGDHKKAQKYHLKAMEIRERILPQDHPELAQSFSNVGMTYRELGEYKSALEYLLKAREILEETLPTDHQDIAIVYNGLGSTYGNIGDHQKALDYELKALRIMERTLPENHPFLAAVHNNVGHSYSVMDEYVTALSHLQKALAIAENSLPKDHPSTENYREGVKQFTMLLNMQKSNLPLPPFMKPPKL